MIANCKYAALLIGLAACLWLGPHDDSEGPEVAIAHECGMQSDRCMVAIRYTYPAADLSVAEEVYF